jgi:outer membrane receptor protein involved in Fe transport
MAICFAAVPALSQANDGELRVTITDPLDHPVKTSFAVTSTGNQYANALSTDTSGRIAVKTLPYGLYVVRVQEPGFSPVVRSIEVRSSMPAECNIHLEIARVATMVNVEDSSTLIDPHSSSSIMQIGSKQIEERLVSLPGRSVQDLVNSQPGWLYEGNAVLHPRGSEYQTQFVLDGIPLTDNRSPSFGPEIEADDVNSMSIYTAGFPAEYGRKMGGVVEINTKRETTTGVHGQLILSGGSYDTAAGFGHLQDVWGKNTLSGTASGSMTSHYLNPVVPENFTNKGTTGDFSVKYERDFTESDRLSATVRHELSRFLIPNELLQEQAGQVQNADNFETLGAVSYQHIFSPAVLGNGVGMVRDNANNLHSNEDSTPIIAFQHNYFREGYFKGTLSVHHGNQEWKGGVESDATVLHENFNYTITDPDQFDEGTPNKFAFAEQRPDLEQSAFVEDLIRLGDWTVNAGLRWDHYQLLLNENAFSPRLSIGRYLPKANMVLHVAYDRVFQTPSFENILLSSSPQVASLNSSFFEIAGAAFEGELLRGRHGQGFL